MGGRMWTRFIRFRIGTGCAMLWTGGIFWLVERLSDSQKGLRSMEFVDCLETCYCADNKVMESLGFEFLTAMKVSVVGVWVVNSLTMKMEALCSSQALVTMYKTTRRHNAESHSWLLESCYVTCSVCGIQFVVLRLYGCPARQLMWRRVAPCYHIRPAGCPVGGSTCCLYSFLPRATLRIARHF
jgi:hypothetical protein